MMREVKAKPFKCFADGGYTGEYHDADGGDPSGQNPDGGDGYGATAGS
jgi:hypothetical protein